MPHSPTNSNQLRILNMISISFRRARAEFLALAMAIAAAYPLNAQQVSACYAKTTGTMYRIGAPNTPSTCTKASHTAETWGAKLDQNGVLTLTNANGLLAGGTIGQGDIPASGSGSRMMWYPAKAAFRVGSALTTSWDAVNVGVGSFAANLGTIASGQNSVALGSSSQAKGPSSFAAGDQNLTTGAGSIAMGINSFSTARAAVAFGELSGATGEQSVAMGSHTSADGDGSVALGTHARITNTAPGSFLFGDRSSSIDEVYNTAPNSFLVRAVGGVTFMVANGAACSIPAGGGQWACSSSRLLKTGIADLDGEDILAKIRALPVQGWSYTAEQGVRHIGPMAQDFRAAFGLGADDTTIGVLDAAGVSLAGVKALEARTKQLQAENAALRSALDDLAARVAVLQNMSPRP